jgi:hypothetical protein
MPQIALTVLGGAARADLATAAGTDAGCVFLHGDLIQIETVGVHPHPMRGPLFRIVSFGAAHYELATRNAKHLCRTARRRRRFGGR